MIVAVARELGQSVHDVADDPFAVTLYTHMQVAESDWRRDAKARFADIRRGTLTAMAFNKPALLEDARKDLVREITPAEARKGEEESRRAQQRALVHDIKLIDRRGLWTQGADGAPGQPAGFTFGEE